MLRRQLVQSITGDLKVPTTAMAMLNQYRNETRQIEYVALGPEQAGDIPPPTPEVLNKYFEDRKTLFRAPEYRKITILALAPADLAKPDAVSDADAKVLLRRAQGQITASLKSERYGRLLFRTRKRPQLLVSVLPRARVSMISQKTAA